MLPQKPVRLQLGALLAADPTTLAPVGTANVIALIMAPFALSETTPLASLTFATFTGSTPIAGETGAQLVATDPITFNQIITLKAPIGGFRFVTGDLVNLPQTIYGFALLDNAMANLFALAAFNPPIPLVSAGQQISVDDVTLTLVQLPIS